VLLGPEGILGTHRKVFTGEHTITAADQFAVFDTRIGKVGLLICADLSYAPEAVRCMVAKGAEVIVNSTAWGIPTSPMLPDAKTMPGYLSKMDMRGLQYKSKIADMDWPFTEYREYQYDILARATAMINQVWLVNADTVGSSEMKRSIGNKGGGNGHSNIVSPVGKIVDEYGYEEGLAIATVDVKGGIAEANAHFGRKCFEQWYPEAHAPLFDKEGVRSVYMG
jgi:predicted amidohydrolase